MVPFGARLGGVRTRVGRAARYELGAWLRGISVRGDQVLYESFAGNGMLDHPEAIFRELLADPAMGHLEHVWALSDLTGHTQVMQEFEDNPRVRFVRRGSAGYEAALARSGYLVNNATFPQTFAKRPGQVYLNTWHGTPLKTMGYDMPDGAAQSRNVVRNFLAADYLLAPNPVVEDMYLRSYRLRNVFRGRLICAGSPRVDAQFASEPERERTRSRLRAAGVATDASRRLVLFAPTWKGKQFGSPVNDVGELARSVRALQERLDPSSFQVVLRVHQQVYKFAVADPTLRGVLVPIDVPANQVLALTDVLVSDYSSVFVDFLATGRPVVFFAPDLERYGAERGLTLPIDQWPGPVCRDLDQLARRVELAGTGRDGDPAVTHAELYRRARDRYCAAEDGKATGRVVDMVFRGRESPEFVRTGFGDGRRTVLIYLGGVRPNGITSSVRSLLDAVDYDRFDVSAFYQHTDDRRRGELIEAFDPRVRLLARDGAMLGHKWQLLLLQRKRGRGRWASHADDVRRSRRLLREEWTRCFGDAHFDFVIDFSGYSPLWNKVLLQGGAASFSTWLHNDLAADARRKVGGKYPHRANLEAMFELYRYTDHLVSVSPALARVNAEKLSQYADASKFTSARNTIDAGRIRRLAYGDVGVLPEAGGDGAAEDDRAQTTTGLVDDVRALVDRYGIERVYDEAKRRHLVEYFLPACEGVRTFVTVGRISPEKNHERMITAFADVHRHDSNTRLLIIGSGPLRPRLERLVAAQGLGSSVRFAGHQYNPYPLLAASDCFVLSSDYEGQPMVILEAIVLGLPVVTTSFDSVADALPDGYGLVVDRSRRGVAAGMRAFLQGTVPVAPFDADAYNKQAVTEFEAAIGA